MGAGHRHTDCQARQAVPEFSFKINQLVFVLFEREGGWKDGGERREKREKWELYPGGFLTCFQQLGVGQAEARSLQLCPGLLISGRARRPEPSSSAFLDELEELERARGSEWRSWC